jgi:hypothetical protein
MDWMPPDTTNHTSTPPTPFGGSAEAKKRSSAGARDEDEEFLVALFLKEGRTFDAAASTTASKGNSAIRTSSIRRANPFHPREVKRPCGAEVTSREERMIEVLTG